MSQSMIVVSEETEAPFPMAIFSYDIDGREVQMTVECHHLPRPGELVLTADGRKLRVGPIHYELRHTRASLEFGVRDQPPLLVPVISLV